MRLRAWGLGAGAQKAGGKGIGVARGWGGTPMRQGQGHRKAHGCSWVSWRPSWRIDLTYDPRAHLEHDLRVVVQLLGLRAHCRVVEDLGEAAVGVAAAQLPHLRRRRVRALELELANICFAVNLQATNTVRRARAAWRAEGRVPTCRGLLGAWRAGRPMPPAGHAAAGPTACCRPPACICCSRPHGVRVSRRPPHLEEGVPVNVVDHFLDGVVLQHLRVTQWRMTRSQRCTRWAVSLRPAHSTGPFAQSRTHKA